MLELWQAEWCPESHRVRERLTELGVDFVARQAAPFRWDRDAMREAVGTDSIPVLVTEDGRAIADTDEALAFLAESYEPSRWAEGHREQESRHPALRQGSSHGDER